MAFRSLGVGLLLLCAGCASLLPRATPPEQPLTADAQQRLSSQLLDTLASSFPTGVTMRHRAVLTIAGRQFALDGHVTTQTNGTLELLVMGPMGVLADLTATPAGAVEVRRHDRRFRERWVELFMARDARLLFTAPPDGAELRASVLEDGTPFLERRLPGRHHVCRYVFDPGGGQWKGLIVYRDGRSRYRAACAQTRTLPGQRRELPAVFDVTAERYQLSIRVVQLSPIPPRVAPDPRPDGASEAPGTPSPRVLPEQQTGIGAAESKGI